MSLPPDYELRVLEVAEKLHDFIKEHCGNGRGQLDGLLFALAAMQCSGVLFSLLPGEVAEHAMRLTADRLGRAYLDSKHVGDAN